MSYRLIAGKYKTYEGARKRCAFENAMAPGEYARGDKAKLWRYTVLPDPNDSAIWRVARFAAVKADTQSS